MTLIKRNIKVFAETKETVSLKPDERTGIHTVSPYKLIWDNSQCYLICGKKDYSGCIRILNFRADRIYGLSVSDEETDKLDKSNAFYDFDKNTLDAEKYLRSIFEMFGSKDGKLTKVTFTISKKLKGTMIDKFGKSVEFKDFDDNHISFTVPIQKSSTFFGWLAKFKCDEVKITSPHDLIEEYKEHLKNILDAYGDNNT